MSYELRAFVCTQEASTHLAGAVAYRGVPLSQGLTLVPVSDEALHARGGGDQSPFGDTFHFMSAGLEEAGRDASRQGGVAYLEADLHGGTGTQAAVVWNDGEVILGPVLTDFGWPAPPRTENHLWAFNSALRSLGVMRDDNSDEFDSCGLGAHRATEDWFAAGP